MPIANVAGHCSYTFCFQWKRETPKDSAKSRVFEIVISSRELDDNVHVVTRAQDQYEWETEVRSRFAIQSCE
jgi:hypothetical protein